MEENEKEKNILGQVNLQSYCTACHYFANIPIFISILFLGKCFNPFPLSSAVHYELNNNQLMLLKLSWTFVAKCCPEILVSM